MDARSSSKVILDSVLNGFIYNSLIYILLYPHTPTRCLFIFYQIILSQRPRFYYFGGKYVRYIASVYAGDVTNGFDSVLQDNSTWKGGDCPGDQVTRSVTVNKLECIYAVGYIALPVSLHSPVNV